MECPAPSAVAPPGGTSPSNSASSPPPEPLRPRGQLERSTFAALPRWHYALTSSTWGAFKQSCKALGSQPAYQNVCAKVEQLPDPLPPEQQRTFFEANFTPWAVRNPDGSNTGLITGYYEPLLQGSRAPSTRFRYPLYTAPANLLTIDLSSAVPELKGRRLRGRLVGNRVIPYWTRGEIDSANSPPLAGDELVWVDDQVDAFFLQIQGSGRIKLAEGGEMRVGYADQNGQPFHGIGRLLVQQGELSLSQATLPGIKAWARAHPERIRQILDHNPSYVFFRELPPNLPGPLGALGIPVSAGTSLAVDPRIIPLGSPVFLDTTYPASHQPLRRLMLAQDTGGAIYGAVRADFFWGFGTQAEHAAGTMRQSGRLWLLYPSGFEPPSPQ